MSIIHTQKSDFVVKTYVAHSYYSKPELLLSSLKCETMSPNHRFHVLLEFPSSLFHHDKLDTYKLCSYPFSTIHIDSIDTTAFLCYLLLFWCFFREKHSNWNQFSVIHMNFVYNLDFSLLADVFCLVYERLAKNSRPKYVLVVFQLKAVLCSLNIAFDT